MAYEAENFARMPEALKYGRAAKRRLRTRPDWCGASRVLGVEEHSRTCAGLRSVEDLEVILSKDCSRHGKPHQCLHPFREAVGSVRTWRVLWASLPRKLHVEFLTGHLAEDLARHLARGASRDNWSASYRFLGEKVCKDAFLTLAGILVRS